MYNTTTEGSNMILHKFSGGKLRLTIGRYVNLRDQNGHDRFDTQVQKRPSQRKIRRQFRLSALDEHGLKVGLDCLLWQARLMWRHFCFPTVSGQI